MLKYSCLLLLLAGIGFVACFFLLALNGHQFVAQILAESHEQRILVLQMLQDILRALIAGVAESHLTQAVADCQHLLLVLLHFSLVTESLD